MTADGTTPPAPRENQLDRERLRVLVRGALAGLVCLAIGMVVGHLTPEPIGLIAYIVVLTVAVTWRAFDAPAHALPSVGVVWATQPALLFIIELLSGELLSPSRSTGGMVGFLIALTVMLLILPVLCVGALLGWALARWRERRAGRARADDDAASAGT